VGRRFSYSGSWLYEPVTPPYIALALIGVGLIVLAISQFFFWNKLPPKNRVRGTLWVVLVLLPLMALLLYSSAIVNVFGVVLAGAGALLVAFGLRPSAYVSGSKQAGKRRLTIETEIGTALLAVGGVLVATAAIAGLVAPPS
jgi:hypothetical protein